MKKLFLSMAVAAALLNTSARAETIRCTEITALPFTITVQGVYCLRKNRGSAVPTGNAIDIRANNVAIDLNGFRLNGLGAGAGTTANGIFASNRKNITIRNGTIRGFRIGIVLQQLVSGISSDHLLEDLLLDRNRSFGVQVAGSGNVIRNNRVVNTGPVGGSGIFIRFSRNTVIADNVVSGTSATSTARGIRINNSALIEVRGNSILDVKGGGGRGIGIFLSTDVTVTGNRIFNLAGTGTTGIIDSFNSTGINCIDNIIAGYTTPLSGCDVDLRNDKL